MEKSRRDTIFALQGDKIFLEILCSIFNSRGYTFEKFSSAKEAHVWFSEESNRDKCALCILERSLADGDGLQLIQEWNTAFKELPPFFVLSEISSEVEQLAAYRLGVLDYIPKPINLPIFTEKSLATIKRIYETEE